MHISEGVLSAPVLLGGAALALPGIALGLRKLKDERMMGAALLSANFFAASLIHVPIGPGNAHLILNGFLGILLGWAAFPAIFTALLLQALLFSYGGLSTLGVNTLNMALPAVIFAKLFTPLLYASGVARLTGAFLTGACSVAVAGLLTALALAFTSENFLRPAQLLFIAHLPIILVEGLVSALAFSFIARVRPELPQFFRS